MDVFFDQAMAANGFTGADIEGQFLARLVRLSGAKRILELGTFTG